MCCARGAHTNAVRGAVDGGLGGSAGARAMPSNRRREVSVDGTVVHLSARSWPPRVRASGMGQAPAIVTRLGRDCVRARSLKAIERVPEGRRQKVRRTIGTEDELQGSVSRTDSVVSIDADRGGVSLLSRYTGVAPSCTNGREGKRWDELPVSLNPGTKECRRLAWR